MAHPGRTGRKSGNGARALERMTAGLNVSVSDFADLIGCSRNHVWKLIREGKIAVSDVDGIMSIPAHEAAARSGALPAPAQALAA